jgi:hypothetical protein
MAKWQTTPAPFVIGAAVPQPQGTNPSGGTAPADFATQGQTITLNAQISVSGQVIGVIKNPG